MAGDSAPSKASAISGWTAFSNPNFVKSALADMQATTVPATQRNTTTPVADVADATFPISQINNGYLSDPSPSNSEPTQEEKDKLLIADPPRLAGEALIDLSRRFSTADIVELSNTSIGGNLTRVAINGRLNTALAKKAKALGTTKSLLKEELIESRKAQNIRSTCREPDQRHSVVGGGTEIGRKARGIKNTRRRPDHRHSVVGEDAQVRGEETSDVRQTQVSKSDQAYKNIQAKPAPQADAATSTHQPKGANTAKEKINTAPERSAKDAATLAAQKQADHEAFQDQNSLKGDKLLLLAERYSNADISAHIRGILGNYPLTENGVATRIHVALEKRAKATGVTTEQVRDDLNAARIASGAVKPTPRGRGILRPPKGPKASKAVGFAGDSGAAKGSVVAEDGTKMNVAVKYSAGEGGAAKGPVVVKDGAKMTGAVRHSARDKGEMEPPKKRTKKTHETKTPVAKPVAVQLDAEMTEDGFAAGSQDGHDAHEVEAANALLELADGGAEVGEAATTLMDMHRESSLSDGQGEAVVGDLDDAEVNDV